VSSRATVTIRAYPLWRLRLRRGLARYLVTGAASLGILASARYAFLPPGPIHTVSAASPAARLDRSAEGLAVLFARRYLTWSPPEAGAAGGLEQFAGAGMEADAGLVLPAGVLERVAWAEVVQGREPLPGHHVYTVAAQTDTEGLLYLTVGVVRLASGALAISGYPAFVGPPDAVGVPAAARGQPVDDPALEVVLRRALGNYMSGSASELAADLTAEAQVSLPPNALTLETIGHPTWTVGSAVQVVAQAGDSRGVHYTLAYELDVVRVRGRWEIGAIQTDPRS